MTARPDSHERARRGHGRGPGCSPTWPAWVLTARPQHAPRGPHRMCPHPACLDVRHEPQRSPRAPAPRCSRRRLRPGGWPRRPSAHHHVRHVARMSQEPAERAGTGRDELIGGMGAVWRERARAEGPRRAADRDRPSSAPGWWRSRAAPWGTHLPRPPSHQVRGRGLALLAGAARASTPRALRGPSLRGQPRTCRRLAQGLHHPM